LRYGIGKVKKYKGWNYKGEPFENILVYQYIIQLGAGFSKQFGKQI
jgi:hypothetical protein